MRWERMGPVCPAVAHGDLLDLANGRRRWRAGLRRVSWGDGVGLVDDDAGCRADHQWQKLINDIFAVDQLHPLEEWKLSGNTPFPQRVCFLAILQVA